MIEKARIRNYQSHKDTTLEFSSGVNIIVGQSDSGKSAILRGLNWAVNNKPNGESIRSHWGGDTIVSIVVDGKEISRERLGKTGNQYTLDYIDNPLKGFGQTVPQEVSKLVNMSDINIQQQMDSPFLLSETSGEVARQLNKVVNLEAVDTSIANVAKWESQRNSSIKEKNETLGELKASLAAIPDLEVMEEEIADIEKMEERHRLLQQRERQLASLQDTYDAEKDKYDKNFNLIQAEPKIKELACLYSERDKAKSNINNLLSIYQEYLEHKANQDLPIIKAESVVSKMLELTMKREDAESQLDRIENLYAKYKAGMLKVAKNKMLEEKLIEEMPDVCPTCGQEIK